MGLRNLYYANSLRNLIMKICAYLTQIPNFGFDARSVPMILERSNFYPSVFTPIHILFKVLQKFLRKKTFFRYTLMLSDASAMWLCYVECQSDYWLRILFLVTLLPDFNQINPKKGFHGKCRNCPRVWFEVLGGLPG